MAEKQREWQEKESKMRQKIFELETANLPAEEVFARKEQLYQEEIDRQAQIREDLERKLKEKANSQDWISFFVENGVSQDKLDMSQGVNELVQSGWNEIIAQRNELLEKITDIPNDEPASDDEDSNDEDATVVTSGGKKAAGKETWSSLLERGYSHEEIFQMVDDGILDPSVLP
jgi:hypothetical protein